VSARVGLLLLVALGLAGFAVYLLMSGPRPIAAPASTTATTTTATTAPAPPNVNANANANANPNANPNSAAPPVEVEPMSEQPPLPPPPPRSQIPSPQPSPPPPPAEFRTRQKLRAGAMLDSELRVLEEEQRRATAAGDSAQLQSLAVRLRRLRERKDQLDQELHGGP
jgi:outer membrane biosynthesis protein TonB